jgi:DNA polymerase I
MKNRRIDRDEVIEKFGVPPEKVVDVQSLAGDSVDNVPGAPGIGLKTAALLINEYGDLETLLARAGEIPQPKRREALVEYADLIRISKRLVTLDTHAPVEATLEALEVKAPDPDQALEFLTRMEFRTLTKRVAEALKVEVPTLPEPNPPAHATDEARQAPEEVQPPFVHENYECVRDRAALEAWIALARERGDLAVDTETKCEPNWWAFPFP